MENTATLTAQEQETLSVLIQRAAPDFLRRKQAGESEQGAATGALQDVLKRDQELLEQALSPKAAPFRKALSAHVWATARRVDDNARVNRVLAELR